MRYYFSSSQKAQRYLNFLRKRSGRMAEWSNAAVSKTVIPQGIAGSNPAPSVKFSRQGKILRILSERNPAASGIVSEVSGKTASAVP